MALGALAQDKRLSIFRLLVEAGPAGISVGEIGAAVDAAPATLSFHLKELARAGLVEARQEGRFIFYSANYRQMNELLAFLTQNCCARNGGVCATAGKDADASATTRSAQSAKGLRTNRRRAAAR